MICISQFIVFVTAVVLNQYLAQANIFSCNTTAPCGCSKNAVIINSRIVGGEPAASHSWTWAVSLRVRSDIHFCGGSIISPHYVLTAAHCIDDPYISMLTITAAVGTDNLHDNVGQRITVSTIYKHPRYNKLTHANDIAILRLKKAISFQSSNIGKLCLPALNEIVATDFPMVNSDLVAIGWGKTDVADSSNVLRQVTVTAVSSTTPKCANSIHDTKLQFCSAVNGGGKDTCQGDSGGPLMYYSNVYRQWVVAGITSYGTGCGLANYAGVYARASMYIDWIKSIVGNDGVVIMGENAANISTMSNVFCLALVFVLFMMRLF
ncbi:unnamed protein product [Rotaria magnacalcarata]|uniref:Peptidase S1 domain-containing protein n=1 Tax=Rotaria magnacalcarata TaxID=392030 RepID=A0A819S5P3_9BILA|nr:unnamed protein product [Rotaria magnacalcarata]CAF4054035.1 unnamed protein product [Rotaria magnacalcarata]